MQAVVQTGGKQYLVVAGDVIDIERLEGDVGTEVTLSSVIMLQDEAGMTVASDALSGASVRGRILRQGRARKIVVFKKKRRKNYRRTQGHRQSFTRLQIVEVLKG